MNKIFLFGLIGVLMLGTAFGACNTLDLTTNATNGTTVNIGSCYDVSYEINGTPYTMTINNIYFNSTYTPTSCSVTDTINPGGNFLHNSTNCFVDIGCGKCPAVPKDCIITNHTVSIRYQRDDDGTVRIISPFQDELIGSSANYHQWSWKFECSNIILPENLDEKTNKTYEECKSYFGNFSDTFVLALCMDEVSTCRENYGTCTFNYQSLLTDCNENKNELALCAKDKELFKSDVTQNELTMAALYGELDYTKQQNKLTEQQYQDWTIFLVAICAVAIVAFIFYNYRREESIYG